jgi:bifunctional non-homologous end joining protein LigD
MLDREGVSDFFALHAALASSSAPSAQLVAFDLLHLDGQDLGQAPLEERRSRLTRLIGKPTPAFQFSEEIGGEGAAALRSACELDMQRAENEARIAADMRRPFSYAY